MVFSDGLSHALSLEGLDRGHHGVDVVAYFLIVVVVCDSSSMLLEGLDAEPTVASMALAVGEGSRDEVASSDSQKAGEAGIDSKVFGVVMMSSVG